MDYVYRSVPITFSSLFIYVLYIEYTGQSPLHYKTLTITLYPDPDHSEKIDVLEELQNLDLLDGSDVWDGSFRMAQI
jgi:hypothetical protein